MDPHDARMLFEYNAWANRRILETCARLSPEQFLQDLKSSFPSIRDTLAHIYGAEWIWLERWNRRSPAVFPKAADFGDCESIRSALADMDAALIEYVNRLRPENLTGEIEYKMMNGAPTKGPMGPMLQHLASHSTYHRGQVTTMLRQLGAQAVSTDLIGYCREIASTAST